MWNRSKKSPGRTVRSRQRSFVRSLRLESLEPRACPAVLFEFANGVLNLTGDSRPNTIEIFQPRDRVVEVKADGERRTFSEVDEVFIDTKEGDDTVRSSKPKEIVVVGSKINIHTGAGNDLVQIDDGGATRQPVIWNTALDLAVDLGMGADEVLMKTHHHDQIDLDLTSGDGGDRILVGMLLPAVQKVREAAARIELDLAGDGNVVTVNTKDFDQIDLRLRAVGDKSILQHELGHTLGFRHEHTRPEARVNFDIRGDGNQLGLNTRGVDQVDLDLGLTGEGNRVEIVLMVPAVQRVRYSAARAQIDLGGGGNFVDVRTEQIRDVSLIVTESTNPSAASVTRSGSVFTVTFGGSLNTKLDLKTGDGDDEVRVDNQPQRWFSEGPAPIHQLSIDTGGGDDKVVVHAQAGDPFPFTRDGRSSGMVVDADENRAESLVDAVLNLGDGNDTLTFMAEASSVNLDAHGGGGDDKIKIGDGEPRGDQGYAGNHSLYQDIFIPLGNGVDELTVKLHQADTVNLDVHSADGFDSVDIRMENALPGFGGRARVAVADVNLEGGNNLVNVHTDGYDDVDLEGSFAGGDNQVEVGVLVLAVQKVREAAARVSLDFGGSNNRGTVSNQGFGIWEMNLAKLSSSDTTDVPHMLHLVTKLRGVSDSRITPTGTVTFIIDGNSQAGPVGDIITIRGQGFGAASVDVDTAGGNDSIWIDIGAPIMNVSVDTGAGDDHVKIKPLFAFRVEDLDGPAQLDISANLGGGDDRLEIDASGYGRVNSFIDTDAGQDRVSNRLYVGTLSFAGHDTHLNAVTLLGAGDDHLEFDTFGYAQGNFLIGGGDGDDEIRTKHQWLTHLDRTHLNLVIMLGAGSDTLAIDAAGYHVVKMAIESGPEGDGSDNISANVKSLHRNGRKQAGRVVLDGGLDVYEYRALGYLVQGTNPTPISVEWVFVAI